MEKSASRIDRPSVDRPLDSAPSELVRHGNHAESSSRPVPASQAASLRLLC
jgi:hypothetical protein